MARHIVTKHLIRRTARQEDRHLKHMQQIVGTDIRAAIVLRELHVRADDVLAVEKAGRIRARWIVTASRP